MNGPGIVCAGCAKPISIKRGLSGPPFCRTCLHPDILSDEHEAREARKRALKIAQEKLERLKRGVW